MKNYKWQVGAMHADFSFQQKWNNVTIYIINLNLEACIFFRLLRA